MWKNVYLALLVIGILVAGFFAYYAWSWLQSIGDPRAAWDGYNYHRRMGIYFMAGWTAVLVIVANVVLWNTRNAWAVWASHLYFIVFSLVIFVALHLRGTSFCIENGVCENPSKFIGFLIAFFGSVAVGLALFADQYVILRLQERMHGKAESAKDEIPETENSREEPES